MANADAAYGFKPVHADGSPTSGATMRYVFAAGDTVAAFIGDPVKIAGTSIDGAPTIAQAAAGDPVFVAGAALPMDQRKRCFQE